MFLPPGRQRPHRFRRFCIIDTVALWIDRNHGRSCCVLMREGSKATAAYEEAWWASC
jgi:hypothetical protein